MSKKYEIGHLAFVVEDLDASMRFITSLGAKLSEKKSFKNKRATMNGVEYLWRCEFCSGYLGDMGIEIFCPQDDKTPYGQFMARTGGGLYFISFDGMWENMKPCADGLVSRGLASIFSSAEGPDGPRAYYMDVPALSGTVIELKKNYLPEPAASEIVRPDRHYGVGCITLAVEKLEAAKAFMGVLGAHFAEDAERSADGAKRVVGVLGGRHIMLVEPGRDGKDPCADFLARTGGGIYSISFDMLGDELEAAKEELVSKGAELCRRIGGAERPDGYCLRVPALPGAYIELARQ